MTQVVEYVSTTFDPISGSYVKIIVKHNLLSDLNTYVGRNHTLVSVYDRINKVDNLIHTFSTELPIDASVRLIESLDVSVLISQRKLIQCFADKEFDEYQ